MRAAEGKRARIRGQFHEHVGNCVRRRKNGRESAAGLVCRASNSVMLVGAGVGD